VQGRTRDKKDRLGRSRTVTGEQEQKITWKGFW